jgi:undecaprenyl-diphosphatase
LLAAVLLTLLMRPWVQWPAPNINPQFISLFPRYLWGTGNWNCFPSHSTLAYFTVAIGFYSLNRAVSFIFMLATLLLISVPRIYVGGHYPIDVVFSCALAWVVSFIATKWREPQRLIDWLRTDRRSFVHSAVFFYWVFELGEGFRGTELLFSAIRRWLLKTAGG